MSQSEKAAYFNALKDAGVTFERHYREYKTDELKAAYDRMVEQGAIAPTPTPEPQFDPAATAAAMAQMGGPPAPPAPAPAQPAPQPPIRTQQPPVRDRDPHEMAGQRQSEELAPIRTDELGRVWFQEEVRKPAYPKPRGRRVLTYMDSGAIKRTVTNGEYTETFEIPGDPKNAREQQVKITLPSYQVGIYKDPRFPFKVVTYNDNEGFDLQDVQDYYGGSELVPAEIKRKYVENVLCYDIRTVVRAIETEYRTRVLGQRV